MRRASVGIAVKVSYGPTADTSRPSVGPVRGGITALGLARLENAFEGLS